MKRLLTGLGIGLLSMLDTGVAAGLQLTPPVAEGLQDPIEIAVSENGDLYVAEREGRILRVRPSTGGMFEIGKLEVAALRASAPDSPVSREDGILGLALDPAFEKNQRLYLYYSDPKKPLNRLARFMIRDGRLDVSSEKTLLEIPMERDKRVSHEGGSLAVGPDGLLYLSTGDNTSVYDSGGVAPVDDRENRKHYDAQRSAGNTNDLRGKILRLKLTEEGYEIPAGNLFPPGTPQTRAEIYAMGCRNPFRISIDPKTSTLYWGEVGPDAKRDGDGGPMGYDEINQAKKAGNFGWPFVIADNNPYRQPKGKDGQWNDPAKPVNPGHRNTGLHELPPAQPAFIWYPYGDSERFPELGSGSRNAMAGPVFYFEETRKWNLFNPNESRSLITYDWARGRMWQARLNEKEELSTLTPLLERLLHPMDLAMAPDGTLWLLEYGTNWYFNRDGRIRGIRPERNQAPELLVEAATDRPFTFSVKSRSDADGDQVDVHWYLTDGVEECYLGSEESITVESKSATELRAVATDGKGGVTVKRFLLKAGPAEPSLELTLPANPGSLSFGQKVAFQVSSSGGVDQKAVTVRSRYIPPTGHDAGGHQLPGEIQELITAKACIACHQVEQTSVGPRFLDVAFRFRGREDAVPYLRERLKNGSTGDWGEMAMPPQALTDQEAGRILEAVLALADGASLERGKLQGELTLPAASSPRESGGAWELVAEAPGMLPARLRFPAE
ncbi:MAG TPA: PQQ-dependent sugar dehydrogenase [Haloferula sp.]